MPIIVRIPDGDDGHEEIVLPSRKEVCWQCDGTGKSSARLGAFTGDEMREDPEFFEDYMAGVYDRTCDTCHGDNVVDVIDEDRYEQLPEEVRRKVEAYWEEERAYREECEMERRMGA